MSSAAMQVDQDNLKDCTGSVAGGLVEYLNIFGDVRRAMQDKLLVAIKLHKEYRDLVVLGHGFCLVIQAARDKRLAEIRQGLALNADVRREDVISYLHMVANTRNISDGSLYCVCALFKSNVFGDPIPTLRSNHGPHHEDLECSQSTWKERAHTIAVSDF